MIEPNKIYCENCLDTMSRMPDGFVDLTVTSPPYNMNLRIRGGVYCSRQIVDEFSSKYVGFSDNVPIDKFYVLHRKILSELLRVSKIIFYNIQIVTGSKRAFFKIIGDFSENIKDVIVWDKGCGQPSMHESVLNKRSELILIMERSDKAISRSFEKCNFERGEISDLWDIGRKKIDKFKNHGAAFTESMAGRIIKYFSNEGDLIYDPFMGSGTTAKMAHLMKRNWIGSEISQEYVDLANKRLKKYLDQTDLFTPDKTNGKSHGEQSDIFTRIVLDGRNSKSELKQEKVIL